ncbi:hypothetical protein GCM10020358_35570 [Amorphoplanes nipponensis]|uniref:Uncharacterized protein n=1 Tax=Actinoplanes nipponensis TaxID=135950 RepID=A0A919MXR3_9ACTN|nr:hypothetical protein [Actinoplanes nipponensis]GIE53615.1 hypothetical protein Ani05nite_71490 [Actinoplanes nipponensis]
MYARLQTVAARPADEDLAPRIAALVSGHPGFAGLVLLTGDDDVGGLVSLWLTREDAELASERSAAVRGQRPFTLTRDEIYEVDADEPGAAAGEEPAVAFLGEFDGPLSPARVEAARYAGTRRLAPVLRTVPGLVRMLMLWHPTERRMAALHLATSTAALGAVSEAVMSTTLLPDEDPALLPGPDRIARMRVLAYRGDRVAPGSTEVGYLGGPGAAR